MQLFKVSIAAGVSIQEEIKHIRFRDVLINNTSGKERDLEDFLVQYPGLLNFGDFDESDSESADLLIITRQPITSTRKRADLIGIHRDGSLVVIEVKRDAADERNRVEGMEFQAIRYAAASRKMTVDVIIETYARYLLSLELKPMAQLDVIPPEFNEVFRQKAIGSLCRHLADEEEELSEDDLEDIINPKEKQKIYLVAADYEADVIAACAWLREHNIDVSCFRLRPYRIANEIVLERERLIPPPELDDYITDTFTPSAVGGQAQQSKVRRGQSEDKPIRLIWADDEENPVNVTTWRAMFAQVVKRALNDGLPPNDLPTRTCLDEEDARKFQAARFFESHNVWVDLHGSADAVQTHVRKILTRMNREGLLRVETRNGNMIEF